MPSTVWNPQRGSQSYVEKRRGRREIEVTRRKRGGVKRGETNLTSNQFPTCYPEPRTPREIHRVTWRREEGDIGYQEENRGSQKWTEKSSQKSIPYVFSTV